VVEEGWEPGAEEWAGYQSALRRWVTAEKCNGKMSHSYPTPIFSKFLSRFGFSNEQPRFNAFWGQHLNDTLKATLYQLSM
jgi:hypothetical protein